MSFFALLLLSMAAQAPAHTARPALSYSVDRWTIEEGLPNNALAALMKSRDGYLWLGTLAGITRFDGVRFTPILESLPNAHVRILLEDRAGTIWIGLDGGGLARYQNGLLTTFPPAKLAGANVRTLAEDSRGRIWAGTDNGLSVITGDHIQNLRTEQGLPGNQVRSVAQGRGGAENSIWIATDQGLCQADSRNLSLRCTTQQAPQPSAILQDRLGRLWVGRANGLFSIRADIRTDFTPAFACAEGCFAGRAVTAITESRAGGLSGQGLWIGFNDGGVVLLRDGNQAAEEYGTPEGLVADPVLALTEDAEGSIWIGAYNGGLERLRPKRVRMYSTADGLPAKAVGSIVQDASGTIWAGTQCGPVSELRDGRFIPRFTEYTKGSCAWSLWPARDGALWIGTFDNGFFRWYHNRMEHFGKEQGLSDAHVMAFIENRDGVMFIGTELGGLHTYKDGKLSRAYGQADGVATGQLDNFAQDRQGRVWIGSNGHGLSVYEKGQFHILPPAEQPPELDISGLFVDSHDDLWVLTDRRGAFRRRNNKYEPFGVPQGLGDQLVSLMLEDRSGTLWLSHARGISRITRDKVEAVAAGRSTSLDPIILDRSDGMLNPEVSGGGFDPTGLVDRDGKLWFSTVDGIAVVDPTIFRTNTIEPRVAIESATIGGVVVAPTNGIVRVPAGGPELELRYTAFSILVPRKVRFKYRLHGIESDWQDAGDRRTAYYPHLPPGTYTFEVIAANNDGLWSKSPAAIQVIVAPFWWERPSVRAAGLLLLLLLTGFAVRSLSLRRAAARVAELERQQALDRERGRIAQDIHDDLGSRLTHMALIADDAGTAKGAELATAARSAIQAMDELVWTVNARNDTVDGFVSYAVAYASEYLHAAGIRVRVHSPPEMPSAELDADLRRHLFLSFKEALNNVVKHSGASEVHLSFAATAWELSVEIRDNGRGFDVSQADPNGNGLRGMRERMTAAGGRCEIQSAAGSGTGVHIHVSLAS